jgi:hypothetical protein
MQRSAQDGSRGLKSVHCDDAPRLCAFFVQVARGNRSSGARDLAWSADAIEHTRRAYGATGKNSNLNAKSGPSPSDRESGRVQRRFHPPAAAARFAHFGPRSWAVAPENEDRLTKLSSCAASNFACKIHPTQFSARLPGFGLVEFVGAGPQFQAGGPSRPLARERFCVNVVR